MKHKTWFRLVIKAIGVLLIGLSLPELATFFGLFNAMSTAKPFGGTGFAGRSGWMWMVYLAPYSGSIVQLAIGVYLLFGGKWIVNLCIPSNRPYCPECGYDLSKTTSANCPECGVKLPRDNSTG
ncbi:MAG: hypothetical protein IH988_12095 [Planctomycetes bacterium]|nr:hypothetical protein [Planctomycetota bacterium]